MPDKKTYVARWWEGDVKRKRTFKRKGDRDSFTANRLRRQALGDTPVPTPDTTLAAFVEEYWEVYAIPNLKPNTRDDYMGHWERWLRKRLGGYQLRQLTPLVIGQAVTEMRRAGAQDPTILHALTMLQSVLSLAERQQRIASNPVSKIKKPSKPGGRELDPVPPVTVERLRALLAARDATMVSVFAYAGLRPHELWALDIDHITSRYLLIPADTKTGRRKVNLLAPLGQDLREHLMREGIRGGLVFRNRARGADKPWTRGTFAWWRASVYKPAAKNVGLGDDAIPYDLRASFASLLIWEGHTMLEVAVQLGHSVTICEQHYARVFAGYDPAKRTTATRAIQAARETSGTQLGPLGAGEH
jgi:integrase